MEKIIKLSLVTALTMSIVYADGNVGAKDTVRKQVINVNKQEVKTTEEVSHIDELFTKGKVSGQLEVMYSGYNEGSANNPTSANPYATAIGGQLKFETAHVSGFGAGVEFSTVQAVGILSGDNDKGERATMMVSNDGHYTEVSQAYLEYTKNNMTFRAGRQLIDTPLADSDDIRIVNNTFEAYIATYERDNLFVLAGYLDRWQGTDAGLVDTWQNTGKDGTYLTGVNYESDVFHFSAWYYDISDTNTNNSIGAGIGNKSIYIDGTFHALSKEDLTLDISAQYLNQREDENSGTEANIYGFMVEAGISDLELMAAYNKRNADDDKTSFAGFGGGTLYTNMDNMIIDTISGGDVNAYVLGVSYVIRDVTAGYAYGRFTRDATINLAKEDVIEHNFGVEYAANDNLTFFAIVTVDEDKEDTGTNAINNSGDFTNIRVSASYNF